MKCKKGVFTITTGTGTQIISGLGLKNSERIKLLFMFATYQTSAGATDGQIIAAGMSDGTRHRSVAIVSNDNAVDATTNLRKSSANILTVLSVADATAPTLGLECSLVSFDVDGFTIDKTTNADGTNVIVHFFAICGRDILRVHVDHVASPTVTGNTDITTPAFHPTVVFFLYSGATAMGTGNSTNANFSIGMAISSSKRQTIGLANETVGTSDTWRIHRNNLALIMLTRSTGAVDATYDFVEMLTTGFRLNVTDAPGSANTIYYAAIQGGQFDSGEFVLTSGTGNQDVTTPFDPIGLLVSTDHSATSNPADAEAHCAFCMGAYDGSAQGCFDTVDEDSLDTQENMKSHNEANVLQEFSTAVNATGGSTTKDLEASASFGKNKFSLNKTTNNDAQLGRVQYLAFGDADIDEQAISVVGVGV